MQVVPRRWFRRGLVAGAALALMATYGAVQMSPAGSPASAAVIRRTISAAQASSAAASPSTLSNSRSATSNRSSGESAIASRIT